MGGQPVRVIVEEDIVSVGSPDILPTVTLVISVHYQFNARRGREETSWAPSTVDVRRRKTLCAFPVTKSCDASVSVLNDQSSASLQPEQKWGDERRDSSRMTANKVESLPWIIFSCGVNLTRLSTP